MPDQTNRLTVPPHNIEAEEALLGSILIDERAFVSASAIISPEDFYLVKHRWLYEAAAKLSAAKMPIDLLTVQDELERAGQLAEVGGPAYLTRLITLTPSAANSDGYARLVSEASERRKLIRAASDIATLAYDTGTDIDSVKQNSMRAITASQTTRRGGAEHIRFEMSALYDEAVELSQNPRDLIGMDSGFADYNAATSGVHRGESLLIVGEPGIGKSLWVSQICQNLASAGHPGAIYQMEMRSRSVARRWVSAASEIPTRRIRSGRMEDSDWPLFTEAIARESSLPIYISQATHWTTTTIRADLTRLVNDYGIEWFMLDYFDRLKDRAPNENEAQKIKSIGLVEVIKDFNLAGLIIHTKNKAGMRTADEGLADVSGNRQIIYDADEVAYFTAHKPRNGEQVNQYMRTVRFGKFREENVRAYFDLVLRRDLPLFADALSYSLPIPDEEPLPDLYPGPD